MANSKFQNIWQLLSTNDFKKDIPEKFYCIICKNVSIETFISHCKCRFCSDCIKEYLKDEQKYCPGIKIECKEEYLEMDLNISKDIAAIRSIGRINVKCPNEMCEVRCKLEDMSDHSRVCCMSETKCPYENIGCPRNQAYKENIKTHYDNEWYHHSKLLVEAIDNLRNEFNELRRVVQIREEEINKLNEDSTRKEIIILEMEHKINEMREIHTDGRQKTDMEEMREDLRTKQVTIMDMEKQIVDQRKEIDLLKSKDRKIEKEIKLMREEMIKKKEDQNNSTNEENVNKDHLNLNEDIKNQKKSLNYLKVIQENIKEDLNNVITKVRDLRIFDEREFIWRVDNITKLLGRDGWKDIILWRYSLKIALSVRCKGSNFAYSCRIMKGEFDNFLEWPMKHKVTLSLFNQNTMEIHKTREFCYDLYKFKEGFNKPTDILKAYFGDNFFMTVKEIMDTPGLLLNDSLILSFIIDCD